MAGHGTLSASTSPLAGTDGALSMVELACASMASGATMASSALSSAAAMNLPTEVTSLMEAGGAGLSNYGVGVAESSSHVDMSGDAVAVDGEAGDGVEAATRAIDGDAAACGGGAAVSGGSGDDGGSVVHAVEEGGGAGDVSVRSSRKRSRTRTARGGRSRRNYADFTRGT
jgi:hypothetical protein